MLTPCFFPMSTARMTSPLRAGRTLLAMKQMLMAEKRFQKPMRFVGERRHPQRNTLKSIETDTHAIAGKSHR